MKLRLILLAFVMMLITLTEAQSVNAPKKIFEIERKHEFSSESGKDTFKLTLLGENIFDGVVTFQILNGNGKEIYNVHFTVGDLMEFGSVDGDKAYKRSKEDSTFIIGVLNQFFDERNFTKPAVQDTAEMKDNHSSYENWNLIREDASAIGFRYLLGAEDARRISYSKKKKKVILYFTCC